MSAASAPASVLPTGTGWSGAGSMRAARPAQVYVRAVDPGVRSAVDDLLQRAGIGQVGGHELTPGTVILAAARTAEVAVTNCGARSWAGRYPLLVLAEVVSRAGALAAVRAGATAILRSTDTNPVQLAAAVDAAQHGDGRVPHQVLVRLISAASRATASSQRAGAIQARLTRQQTTVLGLIADGNGNAAIAAQLHCSEHTVKNVIYDLMARLQVRNRSHAVASAIRAGLI